MHAYGECALVVQRSPYRPNRHISLSGFSPLSKGLAQCIANCILWHQIDRLNDESICIAGGASRLHVVYMCSASMFSWRGCGSARDSRTFMSVTRQLAGWLAITQRMPPFILVSAALEFHHSWNQQAWPVLTSLVPMELQWFHVTWHVGSQTYLAIHVIPYFCFIGFLLRFRGAILHNYSKVIVKVHEWHSSWHDIQEWHSSQKVQLSSSRLASIACHVNHRMNDSSHVSPVVYTVSVTSLAHLKCVILFRQTGQGCDGVFHLELVSRVFVYPTIVDVDFLCHVVAPTERDAVAGRIARQARLLDPSPLWTGSTTLRMQGSIWLYTMDGHGGCRMGDLEWPLTNLEDAI